MAADLAVVRPAAVRLLATAARALGEAAAVWRRGSATAAEARAAGVLPAEVPAVEALASWPLLAARLGLERFAAGLPAAERAILWPLLARIEAQAVGEVLRLGATEADVRRLAPAGHPVVGVGEMCGLWAAAWTEYLSATTGATADG